MEEMLDISKMIKKIRLDNHITQEELAKKFFVTPKTISNYENGKRMSDLDFILNFCKIFNISFDYFMNNKDIQESKSEDLILSEKNGKLAIYDKKQSVYLTPHIYNE